MRGLIRSIFGRVPCPIPPLNLFFFLHIFLLLPSTRPSTPTPGRRGIAAARARLRDAVEGSVESVRLTAFVRVVRVESPRVGAIESQPAATSFFDLSP